MKKILMTVLLFVVASDVFAIPTLTEISTIGTTVKFVTKLSEILPKGYKVKIGYGHDYGNGKFAMTCSKLVCSLSTNALPKIDSLTYKHSLGYTIGIYDSKGVLQGETVHGSYLITATERVNAAQTSYTKISNAGETLPDTAKLGTGTTDWACTKDTKTGLIWEVKTTDEGLRDMSNTYTWYEPDAKKNGGDAGYQDDHSHPEYCKGSLCDTYAFTNAVNAKGLCGKNDWRMPTLQELQGLLTETYSINEKKYIDATYFPNTNSWYWSSSPLSGLSGGAWSIGFYFAYSYATDGEGKHEALSVRLVRGDSVFFSY